MKMIKLFVILEFYLIFRGLDIPYIMGFLLKSLKLVNILSEKADVC